MRVAIAAAFCLWCVTKQLTSAVSINKPSKCQDCVCHHKSSATEILLTLMTTAAFKINFPDQSGLQQFFSVGIGSTSEFHHSLIDLSIFLSAKPFKRKIISSDCLTASYTN